MQNASGLDDELRRFAKDMAEIGPSSLREILSRAVRAAMPTVDPEEPRATMRCDDGPPALGGYLLMCAKCGQFQLRVRGMSSLFSPRRGQEYHGICGCVDAIPISWNKAMAVSGMTEQELRSRLLDKAATFFDAGREELENLLRVSRPVTEGIPQFAPETARSAEACVGIFRDTALRCVPVVSRGRADLEYRRVAGAWDSSGMKEGSVSDICHVLRWNLERDARLPLFREFSVKVVPEFFCVDVDSHYAAGAGARYATARVYRVWRTDETVVLCGGKPTVLDPPPGGIEQLTKLEAQTNRLDQEGADRAALNELSLLSARVEVIGSRIPRGAEWSKWLGVFARNLAAAHTALLKSKDMRGDPISRPDIALGLERLCQASSNPTSLSTLAGLYGKDMRREFEEVLERTLRIARAI